jgi:hypothetical protein
MMASVPGLGEKVGGVELNYNLLYQQGEDKNHTAGCIPYLRARLLARA